jgi:hypothetical protein
MNDREVEIFDRFFPEPGQLTVLVKPERFQPTRFAFLVRRSDGSYIQDGTNHAIILPLPGRANRSKDVPVPSITAPAQATSVPTAAEKPASPQSPVVSSAAAPPEHVPPIPIVAALPETSDKVVVEEPPVPSSKPEREPQSQDEVPTVSPPVPHRPQTRPRSSVPRSQTTTVLTTIASEESLPTPVESLPRIPPPRERASEGYGLRLAAILFIAAVLGCLAGYWAYLQLPPAIIPLSARISGTSLIISWPVEQTRQAVYAAIRVNDGAQQPLSPEERSAGSVHLAAPSAGNVKVELVVQHWMRDSRGIIRYVPPPSPAVRVNDEHQ